MIRYSANAAALVKAVLLGEIRKMPYGAKEENNSGNLFAREEIDIDNFNLAELAGEYKALTGKDLSWLQGHRAKYFYIRLNYALRHSSPARYRLCEAGVADALQYGLEYFLSNVSPSCRRLADMAREVSHEVQRMLGYIRFTAPDERTLVARPKLFHDTADLILKRFQARYPHYRLVFILGDGGLAIEKGRLFPLSGDELSRYLPGEDPYAEVWEKYYRSQYIQSRKNIPLASKAIPQKYWDWMPEGRIIAEEKKRP